MDKRNPRCRVHDKHKPSDFSCYTEHCSWHIQTQLSLRNRYKSFHLKIEVSKHLSSGTPIFEKKYIVIRKIEHLGIAVKSIARSDDIISKLLGSEAYKHEAVGSENVLTSFFKLGETKIELLEATSDDSAIARFIEKRGEGIHHIALDVVGIEEELARLKDLGFQLIHDKPKAGADGKKIAFLHPKSTNGILVELCEDA